MTEAEAKIDKFLETQENERKMEEERELFINGCKTIEDRFEISIILLFKQIYF